MKNFYITTAIDYTNGAPHIGHAYEKVLADVLARYHRLKGDDVFFLTGVDQHGQKVQQSAEKRGIPPEDFVRETTPKFRSLWDKLELSYDGWAATTDPRHQASVRAILDRLWNDKGEDGQSKWIYKKTAAGYYSVRQEQFLTDKERGEDGEFGPEWQPVEYREEENFYFRLLGHKQWLLDHIEARSRAGHPIIVPDFRVGELRNAVEKLEGDLCISRPVSRLKWGVPLPESWGAGFVTYVWFDALVNYISFVPGYDPALASPFDNPEFRRRWPALHVLGKDIIIPSHGVYWPIMLKGMGFADEDIPQFLVHGWWNIAGGGKMSKSLGNVVDPDALADKYGAEALRYYLMSDISTGRDADFSEERLAHHRYNVDLANSLGNLLNRSLNMARKYREAKVKRSTQGGLVAAAERAVAAYDAAMQNFAVDTALAQALALATEANQFIEQKAPWKLARDAAKADELDEVLYHIAEALRIIAILLSPVLPQAAAGIFAQLQWDQPFRFADTPWGGLPDGHQLGQPVPLFPRIEAKPDAA